MLVMKKPEPKPNPSGKRQDRHTKPRAAFHADQELFDALRLYVDAQEHKPAESTVIRDALMEFLSKRGYWPPKGE